MKKKILILVAMLFAFIPFANAEELTSNSTYTDKISFESAEIKSLEDTTKGIVLEDSYKQNGYDVNCYITYTITSEYDVEANNGAVNFNIMKDIVGSSEFENFKSILPGVQYIVFLTIKNETNYTFELKEDSLVISSVSYKETNEEGKDVTVGFDGNEIQLDSKHNTYRLENPALKQLLRKGKNRSDYSDSNISELLKAELDSEGNQLYPNGIDDLDKYILDWINNYRKTNYKSLDEMTINDFDLLFSYSYKTNYRETNKVLAALMYNFMYNKGLTVTPENYTIVEDNAAADFSIGNYMRDEAPTELEEQLKDYVDNMEEKESTKFTIALNGPSIGNAYQNHSFGLNVSVKVYAKKYKVVTKYVTDEGKTLAEDVVEEYFNGKEYKTEEKTFEGYELIKVEGEKTGTINASDVEVTYVYQYVLGEGGEEEEPTNLVQTGSEVDYSLMTSALITISLMAIALKTKKKNN